MLMLECVSAESRASISACWRLLPSSTCPTAQTAGDARSTSPRTRSSGDQRHRGDGPDETRPDLLPHGATVRPIAARRQIRRADSRATTPRRRASGSSRRDLDLDDLARRAETLEVHDLVVPRAAAQLRGSVRDGPSTSTSSVRPDEPLGALAGAALDDLDEALHRSHLDLVRRLVGQRRRLGAAARRVDERERAVEADLLDDLERLARTPPRSRPGTRR